MKPKTEKILFGKEILIFSSLLLFINLYSFIRLLFFTENIHNVQINIYNTSLNLIFLIVLILIFTKASVINSRISLGCLIIVVCLMIYSHLFSLNNDLIKYIFVFLKIGLCAVSMILVLLKDGNIKIGNFNLNLLTIPLIIFIIVILIFILIKK